MSRLAILVLVLALPTARPDTLTVSAAVSLIEALQELGRAYEASSGVQVSFNFAGSNVLARQIVNGAPVDAFISADEAQMAVVSAAGMVSPGYPVPLLANRLAVIVPADGTRLPLSIELLRAPELRRLAIGNPEAVPAGVYAKQFLERSGLWAAVERKLLPAGNVRGVVAAVETGAADAGIVYVTDARASKRVRVAATIAGPDAPNILYPVAVISTSRQKSAAERFVAFLQSAEARVVFERYGFRPATARP